MKITVKKYYLHLINLSHLLGVKTHPIIQIYVWAINQFVDHFQNVEQIAGEASKK